MATESEFSTDSRARRFGPLGILLVPLLLAALVLPSALNVNQSNPSPTLEYAPVPAADENPPPNPGNLDTLALAATTGLQTQGNGEGNGGGGGNGALPPPPIAEIIKRVASTKTCVGQPPRQTEDPTSPPCVASFKGDNGGATYQGVTGKEIKILFYNICCAGKEGTYYDMAKPAQPGEPSIVRATRVWQQYFNQRFQTYGRFVHLYMYPATGQTAEAHRADAEQNYQDLKPFAVLISGQDPGSYIDQMSRHGVLTFTGGLDGSEFIPADVYTRNAPLSWGNFASAELKAKLYVDYVCTELHGRPTSFRDAANNGRDRKYGLWFSTSPRFQEVTHFGEVVQSLLRSECGIDAIPHSTAVTHTSVSTKCAQEAQAAVADWQRQSVTTVLHVAAIEPCLTRAASTTGWDPEIVIAGDKFWEGPQAMTGQGAAIRNAVLVTDVPSFARREDTYCITAYRDTDASAPDDAACFAYYPLLQLFTGIQVAGPTLNPKTVDQGFHAIPAVRSNDATTPACFYLPGDYTCTKDATIQYWDQTTRRERLPYDQGPCWRQIDKGMRFIPGTFPDRDQLVGVDRLGGAGICNNSTNSLLLTDEAA